MEAAARDLEGFRGFKGLNNGLKAGKRPNNRGLCRQTQANCRLQRWNSKGLRPEGLVEAAAKDLDGFRGFKGLKGLKAGKRQANKKV